MKKLLLLGCVLNLSAVAEIPEHWLIIQNDDNAFVATTLENNFNGTMMVACVDKKSYISINTDPSSISSPNLIYQIDGKEKEAIVSLQKSEGSKIQIDFEKKASMDISKKLPSAKQFSLNTDALSLEFDVSGFDAVLKEYPVKCKW